jgi:aspartyl-tRNA(Asn)/glutamyl-tRNA(Gln) amidotransferase subunit A
MCSIVGLKPTYGRVSRRGVFPLSYSLDHVGPMTRTVRDNAILLNIIAGHDGEDVGSADVTTTDYAAGLGKGVKGMRIGLARHFYAEDDIADPEQLKAVDDAAEVFRRLGAEVREVRLPSGPEFATCNRLILRSEAFSIHRRWLAERPQDYGDICRSRLLDGASVTAGDYIDALRLRGRLVRRTLDAMADLDVILTASSLDPPCRIDDAEAGALAPHVKDVHLTAPRRIFLATDGRSCISASARRPRACAASCRDPAGRHPGCGRSARRVILPSQASAAPF